MSIVPKNFLEHENSFSTVGGCKYGGWRGLLDDNRQWCRFSHLQTAHTTSKLYATISHDCHKQQQFQDELFCHWSVLPIKLYSSSYVQFFVRIQLTRHYDVYSRHAHWKSAINYIFLRSCYIYLSITQAYYDLFTMHRPLAPSVTYFFIFPYILNIYYVDIICITMHYDICSISCNVIPFKIIRIWKSYKKFFWKWKHRNSI